MFRIRLIHLTLIAAGALLTGVRAAEDDAAGSPQDRASDSPYATWENGPPVDSDFFPIGVWLQNPRNADRYRQAGINVYVGLWQGPTEQQLARLAESGMNVICRQNEVGLNSENNDTIIGWMQGDEPDNAQPREDGEGYGPPIKPSMVVDRYERMKQRDPTRPVLLNLGQGVAYDNYIGRGVRRGHLEDYPEYVKGCDIVSFDIYPVVHRNEKIAGKLHYVAKGVDRLREWASDRQIVWNIIEASRISNTEMKPTARQVRAEVWMSLIHGSRGIVYFVHQFEPRFVEASLLEDPELLKGITELNARIQDLAPVLNSPTVEGAVTVESENPEVPLDVRVNRYDGALYVFAVAMRADSTKAKFKLSGSLTDERSLGIVEVLGEDRSIPLDKASFEDAFAGYGVHLYRIE